jgi:carbon monoxide dehydrogenase subunit G
MKLHQEFTIAHPLDEVWRFFRDVPRVAGCLPGAEYAGAKEDGRHLGKVSAKVGPFQASFEGEAAVHYDEQKKSVALEGKGVDRKGASRGKMSMNCLLLPSGDLTGVVVDSDIQLSGTIAQFGRTGLISEVANALVANFVRNAEAELGSAHSSTPGADSEAAAEVSAGKPAAGSPIGGFALLGLLIKGLFRSLFRRSSGKSEIV